MNRDFSAFGLLKISGADARKFLQGQLTCDLDKLSAGQFTLGAHCNPQGRVISLFYLIHLHEHYYLFMHRRMLDLSMQHLKKYAVFYKAALECASDELVMDKEIASLAQACFAQLVSQSVPCIYPETSGKFLPHELNLPKLNAIDFNKGCYTGQEIIARMQYRGKIKNQLYRYQLLNDTALAIGSDLYSGGKACGSVVDVWKVTQGYEALIIMNEACVHDQQLSLKDNIPIQLHLISDPASPE